MCIHLLDEDDGKKMKQDNNREAKLAQEMFNKIQLQPEIYIYTIQYSLYLSNSRDKMVVAWVSHQKKEKVRWSNNNCALYFFYFYICFLYIFLLFVEIL